MTDRWDWLDSLATFTRWVYYEGTDARTPLDIGCALKEYDALTPDERERWRRAAKHAYYEGYNQ